MIKQNMGGCQNYDPFFRTLHIRCRIIIGFQKGTIILTTAYMSCGNTAKSLRLDIGASSQQCTLLPPNIRPPLP